MGHGLSVFAGVLMLVAGLFHVLAGVAALVNDRVYVVTPEYVYAFDLTNWGWHTSCWGSCSRRRVWRSSRAGRGDA